MKHSLFNFLCSALIPELCSNVAAGSARHAHLVLVTVTAVRALPDKFAVLVIDDLDLSGITAFHTVIAAEVCVVADTLPVPPPSLPSALPHVT